MSASFSESSGTAGRPRCSLVIPVYKSEETLPALLDAIELIAEQVDGSLEAVLVVDGSPDQSLAMLRQQLPTRLFPSTLVSHSRNFGAFAAIRTGLAHAHGDLTAVMAADLQEPPELVVRFFETLGNDTADIVVGTREGRDDPISSSFASRCFWAFYRRFVQPDMPVGGVDVFACNQQARFALLSLPESHSSLVGQLIWLGFRRAEVPYFRQPRAAGKSAWTFRKKLRYMADSVFSFTDLPIRLLTIIGGVGACLTSLLSAVIMAAWAAGWVDVRGYTPLMLAILFVGTLILLGLGVVGSYVWRGFENTKQRPLAVVEAVSVYKRSDS